MNTFKKLNISSEKLMKDEELVNLRGGYTADLICQCGFYGQYYSGPFLVTGQSQISENQAFINGMQMAGYDCYPYGATCNWA